jgi:hypothetical protein
VHGGHGLRPSTAVAAEQPLQVLFGGLHRVPWVPTQAHVDGINILQLGGVLEREKQVGAVRVLFLEPVHLSKRGFVLFCFDPVGDLAPEQVADSPNPVGHHFAGFG